MLLALQRFQYVDIQQVNFVIASFPGPYLILVGSLPCVHIWERGRDDKTESVLRTLKQDFVEIDTSVQCTWSRCWHGNPYVEKCTLLADDFCSTQC